MARYTEQALGRGYRHIKLHEITVPEVKAARDVAGPGVPIMVDTNCPWTVREAIEMAQRLSPFDLHWLEEPVWPPENLTGLAEVRSARRDRHRRRRELRHRVGVSPRRRGRRDRRTRSRA